MKPLPQLNVKPTRPAFITKTQVIAINFLCGDN